MNTTKYDINLLNTIMIRDESNIVGEYTLLNVCSLIKFICKCGKEGSKKFRSLYNKGGAFCKECTKVNRNTKVNNTYNSKTEEEKQKSNEKRINTRAARPEEEKQKSLEKQLASWNSRPEEEKQKSLEKQLASYHSRSEEEKQKTRQKIEKTNMEKFGRPYATQSITTEEKYKRNEKRKNTCIERFGCDNPAQNPEIFKKIQQSAFNRSKEYKMPSGIIRMVQGFEPYALDRLLKVYLEEDIITNREEICIIEYLMDNKKKRYFPDIYIPSENKIIEVKSRYIYNIDIEKNKCKGNACKELGFDFEIWIFNNSGNDIEEIMKF